MTRLHKELEWILKYNPEFGTDLHLWKLCTFFYLKILNINSNMNFFNSSFNAYYFFIREYQFYINSEFERIRKKMKSQFWMNKNKKIQHNLKLCLLQLSSLVQK